MEKSEGRGEERKARIGVDSTEWERGERSKE